MTKQNNGGVVDVEIDDEVLVMPSNVIPTPMVGNMSFTDLKSSLTNDEDRCVFTDRTSSSKKVIHTRTRPPQYNCENEAILPVKRSDCDIPNHHQCPNQWLSAPQVKQDGQHTDRQGKRFTSADTNDSKTWLQRGGMLSLLVFAIICSYLMMQYELPGSQTKHCALYNDALTSCHKTVNITILHTPPMHPSIQANRPPGRIPPTIYPQPHHYTPPNPPSPNDINHPLPNLPALRPHPREPRPRPDHPRHRRNRRHHRPSHRPRRDHHPPPCSTVVRHRCVRPLWAGVTSY